MMIGVNAFTDEVIIVVGNDAEAGETHAAQELSKDLQRVYKSMNASILKYSDYINTSPLDISSGKKRIFIGTINSNLLIKELSGDDKLNISGSSLGPEAFVIKSMEMDGNKVLVIAGSDQRGVLYGVYEFSKVFIGIDPYEYWTGKEPEIKEIFSIPDVNIQVASPVFPLRGYFDNDNDMIANWKGQKLIIEFDTWKEMIDSLARLRYNYVDLHDTLGRAEFWNWPYYQDMVDYHTDIELVDKIIDYVHSKGMMVQVPMYLGWEFYHLPYEKICLSKYHDDWMSVYEYYMKETPIGKADLFLQRPRDPWWDRAYRCNEEQEAGIIPGPLMNRMFDGLLKIIKKYRPEGKVVCDLWNEGREMWRKNNFNPDVDIDMMWADNGYADFGEWPEDFKQHKFGIYIHAGYYLNHVMQSPYPKRIKESTMDAVKRGMTHNYFVNGQDFKHFILNLEACARVAWDPEGFDPDAFYTEWTERYFGKDASGKIVESLKELNEANELAGGYTTITGRTVDIIGKLGFMTSEKIDVSSIDSAMEHAAEALELATGALDAIPPDIHDSYDDMIVFPARIYLENLKLYKISVEVMNAFNDRHNNELGAAERKEARERLNKWKKRMPAQLDKLTSLLDEGSAWKKWDGWTKVENFRKITPPPKMDEVLRIMKTLK